jgi:hypothetical protein
LGAGGGFRAGFEVALSVGFGVLLSLFALVAGFATWALSIALFWLLFASLVPVVGMDVGLLRPPQAIIQMLSTVTMIRFSIISSWLGFVTARMWPKLSRWVKGGSLV